MGEPLKDPPLPPHSAAAGATGPLNWLLVATSDDRGWENVFVW